jgi:hypothetical protein
VCSQKMQTRRILHDLFTSTFDVSPPSPAPSPSPPSSLTHTHRCIGYRKPTRHSLPKSARLTYLRVYDSRDSASEPLSVYDSRDSASEPALSPSPPSSLTHAHNIQSHTLPTPTFLTFTCTQVLWCLPWLVRPRFSDVTMRPDTRLTIISTRTTQCMRGV